MTAFEQPKTLPPKADPMSHASFVQCLALFHSQLDRIMTLMTADDRVEQLTQLQKLSNLSDEIKKCLTTAYANFRNDRETWLEETTYAEDQAQLKRWKHGRAMEGFVVPEWGCRRL